MPPRCRLLPVLALVLTSVLAGGARAAEARSDPDVLVALGDLAEMSLEQLADIEVTSVSRRLERLSEAAASVYVITADEIRRSGATTLPEALRLAPNLQVARADANQYAITARGYNSVLANKLLVLVDGRTVYSPLFSGVLWETQDLVLDNVERIEVISGPGGTLWGTNAVNGVINVITRHARETHGVMANGGGGNTVALGEARLGGPAGGAGHWRVSGKFLALESTENAAGTAIADASERWLGSFRTDWGDSSQGFTLLGGGYRGEVDQVLDERVVSGLHVLGAWTRRHARLGDLRVQAWFDRSERDQPGAIDDRLDTWDVEFQHGWEPLAGHHLVWGAGHRHQSDELENLGPAFAFQPASRNLRYTQVFAQDAVHLRADLDLTIGWRLERNPYTKWESMPTAGLSWRRGSSLLWTAYARAVRAPARIDREYYSPAAPPHFVLAGGPDFRSEIFDVWQLGWRAQPSSVVSWSVTGFFHDADRLRSIEPSPAGPVFGNGFEGRTHGAGGWIHLRARAWWRLTGGWVEERRTVRQDAGSLDPTGGAQLGNDPHRWVTLHSAMSAPGGHELDLWLRHAGALPQPAVPAYTSLDARIGIALPRATELSLTGWNLLEPRHAEWGVAPGRPEFERAFFAALRVRLWQ